MKINNLSSELSNLIEEKERLQQDLYKNRALETEKGSYDKELQDQRTKIPLIGRCQFLSEYI